MYDSGISNGLCDSLEGWDAVEMGGRLGKEGAYVCLWLIHVDEWQEPTQHCNYPSIKNKLRKKKAGGFSDQ